MGRPNKRTQKFAATKRLLNPNDTRLQTKAQSKADAAPIENRATDKDRAATVTGNSVPTSLFFTYNSALGPPFHVLMDTNFINFAVKNKIDIKRGMLDCLCAPTVPCITDCVMAELQKLGPKFRIALRVARDKSFMRMPCTHKGTYADDCLVDRVQTHRCFIVGTCDKDLKRRIRKVPGVPIMYIAQHKFTIERLPDAFMAPR